ncbi:hypothetical protein L1887_38978 [Cichorium endivia]|nr:hypothetical protein L1887_38978 [Cichorium endivia]
MEFEVVLETRITLYKVHFNNVLKPYNFYLNKSTHRWHLHLHLLLRPCLLNRGSTMFFLVLEEKILARLLLIISTSSLNNEGFALTRTMKNFVEANRSVHPF